MEQRVEKLEKKVEELSLSGENIKKYVLDSVKVQLEE